MTDQSHPPHSPLASSTFRYVPHPHIAARRRQGPAQTADERVGVNGKIGLFITAVVGTM